MKVFSAALVFPAVLVLFIGCQQQPPPQKGLWKGTVTLVEQKQLPILMYLDLTPPAPSGYFLNGTEMTPIPEIDQRGDSITFVISEYGAAMRGLWNGGRLSGEFLRFRKDTARNKFEAFPVTAKSETANEKATPGVPLVGKYQAYIKNGDKIDSSSVATFWAQGDSVFGSIIAPDGDYGLMAGKQSGNTVVLGRFSGWQGQLMELSREQNHWTGKLFYRIPPVVSFTLEPRAAKLTEVPESQRTNVKDPRKLFSFSGVTVMGDTVTNLDSRFKGKVLIIDVMGTWCHNCMDGAPLLQKLYAEYARQGLEIVGLSFELTGDAQTARRNLLLYEERYGITFPVLFCGSLDDKNVETRLRSQLNNFGAYPTTIFVDRKGRVQSVHEGFKGPGTGEEYQGQIDLYYDIVKKMLESKPARP
jgi:thiol-disulfide isomerase/thioredoxin